MSDWVGAVKEEKDFSTKLLDSMLERDLSPGIVVTGIPLLDIRNVFISDLQQSPPSGSAAKSGQQYSELLFVAFWQDTTSEAHSSSIKRYQSRKS